MQHGIDGYFPHMGHHLALLPGTRRKRRIMSLLSVEKVVMLLSPKTIMSIMIEMNLYQHAHELNNIRLPANSFGLISRNAVLEML